MPSNDFGQGELQGSEKPPGSSGKQSGAAAQSPAMEQLLATLNEVFGSFRQRSLDQGPIDFDADAKKAVAGFNDILAGLNFQ